MDVATLPDPRFGVRDESDAKSNWPSLGHQTDDLDGRFVSSYRLPPPLALARTASRARLGKSRRSQEKK